MIQHYAADEFMNDYIFLYNCSFLYTVNLYFCRNMLQNISFYICTSTVPYMQHLLQVDPSSKATSTRTPFANPIHLGLECLDEVPKFDSI